MNILDIVGPVMVGPSSSHTAGAARIGQTTAKLLGEKVAKANIFLHGSFLATGEGTRYGPGAGGRAFWGWRWTIRGFRRALRRQKKAGMEFSIQGISLQNAHPNSVKLEVTGVSGRKLEVIGASIGGGRIRISEIDGLTANFSGEAPTLVVYNQDRPGCIVKVTSRLGEAGINIGTMQVYRDARGGQAVMVIEVDQEVPYEQIAELEKEDGIEKVIYLCLEER